MFSAKEKGDNEQNNEQNNIWEYVRTDLKRIKSSIKIEKKRQYTDNKY